MCWAPRKGGRQARAATASLAERGAEIDEKRARHHPRRCGLGVDPAHGHWRGDGPHHAHRGANGGHIPGRGSDLLSRHGRFTARALSTRTRAATRPYHAESTWCARRPYATATAGRTVGHLG